MPALRLILGDQLNTRISSLTDCDKDKDIILMCEVWDETKYVKHHKKKIAFLFSAMRHFAQSLKNDGYKVDYIRLDDQDNSGSFQGEIERAVKRHKIGRIILTEAGEYRVQESIKEWSDKFDIDVDIRSDDRFLCDHAEFENWAEGRKELRMEYFYRKMRKKYGILMVDPESPEGGEWNYDAENRKPPKHGMNVPETYNGQIDDCTKEVMDLVGEKFSDHFGDLEPFFFAVTRDQALYALDKFVDERLHKFGDYQDAMVEDEPWMYHSHLSFYINCGLLLPMEVIKKAEDAYYDGDAPLNAVEGFIRQILGWREFIRGVYWLSMPEYEHKNYLQARRKLPDFYWTGETDMNCLRQCVTETKNNAYAHHIQRLMVLGNFALLAGLDVSEVNEWYLIVYADAYQWVEMPNVTGMILYADEGLFASKPYAASGSYINRMSDYCKNCSYNVNKKSGEGACPFNYLYWDFFDRNKEKLKGNPRLNNPYATLSRMNEDKVKAARDSANDFFEKLSNDEKV